MSWLNWTPLALGGVAALLTFNYFLGNPKFWRLVKDHPDEAYGLLFLTGCLVDKKPEQSIRREYTGPFKFYTSDGIPHVVYIPADRIDDIQKQITDAIVATDG